MIFRKRREPEPFDPYASRSCASLIAEERGALCTNGTAVSSRESEHTTTLGEQDCRGRLMH